MSSIYITEPITKGKVVLKTTVGDIDIELWPKETPKACRNFIQLCMEGYYDNTIFHRIIKGFIVQGGDPTGTGEGGESIYGHPFPDEYHTRIRFSHRGIVAMATAEQNQNGSQFFITLDKCPDLQNKHTIFGKVTGDTIFNVLKFNDFQVDEDDRPLYPPSIKSIEIIVNPFDDIVPRALNQKTQVTEEKPKEKTKKNLSLLSFGDDVGEEESESFTPAKMKSAHHFSEDPEERKTAEEVEKAKERFKTEKRPSTSDNNNNNNNNTNKIKEAVKNAKSGDSKDDKDDFSKRMREEMLNKRRKFDSRNTEMDDLDEQQVEVHKENQKEEKLKAMKEEQKRLKQEILAMSKSKEANNEDQETTSLLDEQRAKYMNKKRQKNSKPDEKKVLQALESFKKNITSTTTTSSHKEESKPSNRSSSSSKRKGEEGEISDDDIADNDDSWKNHVLRFEKKRGGMDRRDDVESYTVFDPLKFSKC